MIWLSPCSLQRDGAEAGLTTKLVFSADLLALGLSPRPLPPRPRVCAHTAPALRLGTRRVSVSTSSSSGLAENLSEQLLLTCSGSCTPHAGEVAGKLLPREGLGVSVEVKKGTVEPLMPGKQLTAASAIFNVASKPSNYPSHWLLSIVWLTNVVLFSFGDNNM